MKRAAVFTLSILLMCSCRGTTFNNDGLTDNDTMPPAPYGAFPSEAQVEWHKMEYYMFIHFGPNTFTGVEWGDGTEDPNVFNPTAMDTDQWAEIARDAGMAGVILTAKHHDGFCLWPSKQSRHTVANSSWMGGKGDVVKSLAESCEKYGLKYGVYISPWDQNYPTYGTAQYNQVFANTLIEIHGSGENKPYGDIFEQWFDGAHGAGVNDDFYNWELFCNRVQPSSIIFSNAGPGCRWIGNEDAIGGETNWCTLDRGNRNPSTFKDQTIMNRGEKGGDTWIPGEADISIRPGWFYLEADDNSVKSVDELIEIYYKSVGRNNTLLLNVPPTREGLIHETDKSRLLEFRAALDKMFADNLAESAMAVATNVRGNSTSFPASRAIDGDYDTYWTTDDGVTKASLEITFPEETIFNNIVLQEYIPLGQRVEEFNVQYQNRRGKWKTIDAGTTTTIGYKRILDFAPVTSQKLRINISSSLACPVINNIEVFYTK